MIKLIDYYELTMIKCGAFCCYVQWSGGQSRKSVKVKTRHISCEFEIKYLVLKKMNLLNIDNVKDLSIPAAAAIVIASPSKSTASPNCSPKDKINLCFKMFKLLRRSVILKCLLPVAFLVLLFMLLTAFKSSTKGILIWVETQNLWTTFIIFMLLFTIVSFPFSVGYLVLIISCGYIFSMIKGFLVALLGANLGVAIAHSTIKRMQKKLPIHRWVRTKDEQRHLIFETKNLDYANENVEWMVKTWTIYERKEWFGVTIIHWTKISFSRFQVNVHNSFVLHSINISMTTSNYLPSSPIHKFLLIESVWSSFLTWEIWEICLQKLSKPSNNWAVKILHGLVSVIDASSLVNENHCKHVNPSDDFNEVSQVGIV